MLTTAYAGLTDRGQVREQNEDRWYADSDRGLYLVADGMGGQSAGGLASRAVVEVLPQLLRKGLNGGLRVDDPAAVEQVLAAIVAMSEHLRNESYGQPGLSGMGSTVVLALVAGRQALVAHLGDSRAYLLHGHELRQLTKDHNMAQVLLDCHEIRAEEAASHPSRGQLTRFVGMPARYLPESNVYDLSAGDRLLLCSDGLIGMIGDDAITEILCGQPDPEEACKQLVSAANQAGGKDNITALVIAVSEES